MGVEPQAKRHQPEYTVAVVAEKFLFSFENYLLSDENIFRRRTSCLNIEQLPPLSVVGVLARKLSQWPSVRQAHPGTEIIDLENWTLDQIPD